MDPKPEESPKLPPEKLFEFPRPYLNKELPIRVTAVIDPYNIWAYVKTKESEAFMDQLDKTCQVVFFTWGISDNGWKTLTTINSTI